VKIMVMVISVHVASRRKRDHDDLRDVMGRFRQTYRKSDLCESFVCP